MLIKGIANLIKTYPFYPTKGLGYSSLIFICGLVILLAVALSSKFKLQEKDGKKLILLYLAALIGSIVA